MDKEITKVYESKSDFINDLLTQMKSTGSYYMNPDIKNKIKFNKDLVKSDVDKWIWNKFNENDKFDISLTPSEYVNKYVNTKMRSYGPSNTYYGEWIRAFNKLMYRLMNDGDDVIYGPYSAIRVFLMRGIGDMKFHWGEEFMELQCGYSYNEEKKEWEYNYEYEPMAMNYLIQMLIGGVDFFSLCDDLSNYRSKESHGYSRVKGISWESAMNIYLMIVDQIHDDLKGGRSNYDEQDERWRDTADNYYKNIMEYFDKDLYDILSKHFSGWDAYFHGDCPADSYSSYAEELRISCSYGDYEFEFVIYPLINHKIKFTKSDISEGESNEKIKSICEGIDLWKAFFFKKDKSMISLKKVLNYSGEMNPNEVVISVNNNIIYSGTNDKFDDIKTEIITKFSNDENLSKYLDREVKGIKKDYLENTYQSDRSVRKVTYILSDDKSDEQRKE